MIRFLLSRSIAQICLSLLLSLLIGIGIAIAHQRAVSAQSINSISAEVNSLYTRVNQLENEVRQLSRLVAQINRVSQPNPLPTREKPNSEIASDEPNASMFDRLATLAIELKERVKELEKRISLVEKKLP
jgi:polyhydroxyalkanoate synthesis regulator phasin